MMIAHFQFGFLGLWASSIVSCAARAEIMCSLRPSDDSVKISTIVFDTFRDDGPGSAYRGHHRNNDDDNNKNKQQGAARGGGNRQSWREKKKKAQRKEIILPLQTDVLSFHWSAGYSAVDAKSQTHTERSHAAPSSGHKTHLNMRG